MKQKTGKRRLLTGITSMLLAAAMVMLPAARAFAAEGDWSQKWSTSQVGTNVVAGTEGSGTSKWIKFKLEDPAQTGQIKTMDAATVGTSLWGSAAYNSYLRAFFANGITKMGSHVEGTNDHWQYLYLPKTLKTLSSVTFNSITKFDKYYVYFGGSQAEFAAIDYINWNEKTSASNSKVTIKYLDWGGKTFDLRKPLDQPQKIDSNTLAKRMLVSLLAAAKGGTIKTSNMNENIMNGYYSFDLDKDGKYDIRISFSTTSDNYITKLPDCSVLGTYLLDLSANNAALDWALSKGEYYYTKLQFQLGYDLSKAKITVYDQTYSGNKIEGVETVTIGGNTLYDGHEYKAEYTNNVNVGTATVKISAADDVNYIGTQSATFNIKPADMASSDVKVTAEDVIWPKTDSLPKVVYNGKELVKGKDYDLTYFGNDGPGEVSVKLTGKGNFTGDTSVYYTIKPTNISSAAVTVKDQIWTGNPLEPDPVVKLGSATLVKGTDYTVAYKDNIIEGTATVTVTGKGYYAGTAKGTFKITKPKNTTPENSADSGDSEKPGNSTTPGDSEKPGNSATPGDSEKPGNSTTPGNAEKTENKTGEVKAGDTHKTSAGEEVKVDKAAAASENGKVTYTKAPNQNTVTVPESMIIGGKVYDVETIEKGAFTGKNIRTIVIGKKVKKIKKYAFKGSKATKLIVKTKKLKKKSVKGSLKGSKIKTVQVKVGKKKTNKKYVKKYKKIFTKKNAGRKVKVKR